MTDGYPITFDNVGACVFDVPIDLLNHINNEVLEIKQSFDLASSHANKLAGHIKHEYTLNKCTQRLEEFLIVLVEKYEKQFSYFAGVQVLDKNLPLALDGCWVNFQKKFEFNPPHTHSGVFSFVIWIDIPYLIEEERLVFKEMKEQDKRNGCFAFEYLDSIGTIRSHVIPADKTFNGKLCLFPSRMKHYVSPFYTSDDFRVSVSGNLKLSVNKEFHQIFNGLHFK